MRAWVNGNRRMTVADTPFEIGAEVRCADGVCGTVRRLEVDPESRAVTHLVVEPRHRRNSGRLVPVDLVDDTTDVVRLRCTLEQFERLDPAEEMNFVESSEDPGDAPDQLFYLSAYRGLAGPQGSRGVWTEGQGWDRDGQHGVVRRTITYDSVPRGDVQVRRGDQVHASDGKIGLVEGLVIDPDDHQVTHVLLQEGHLWGRKEVAIPIGAVTSMTLGVQLNLTKQQVEDLPPVDIDQSRR
jgi:sporulation protein YlmC with PRC-barrel domain